MDLSFKRFQSEYYPEYLAWFDDPELNRELGPMDEEWLKAILSEKEEEGITWAIFLNAEMIGVIETVFDPSRKECAWFTALAIKPVLRRQGLGKAILKQILFEYSNKGIRYHYAFIHETNEISRKLFEGLSFIAITEPNEHGYIEYQHKQA